MRLIQIGMHAGINGGVDRYFDGLMRSLHQSTVPANGLLFGDDPQSVPGNCDCLGTSNASLRYRLKLIHKTVSDLIAKSTEAPTLVVSHFALYAWPLLRLVRKSQNVRLVCQFHGPWFEESRTEGEPWYKVLPKRMIESAVYRRAHRIIADSHSFATLATERFGLNEGSVSFVHAGMDAAPFLAVSGADKFVSRERLGWPSDKKILLCVRRLAKRMGIERLISAMPKILEREPSALLMIGGRGPLLNELKDQLRSLGLDNHVRFLGFVPEADLPYAYRAADLSVVPSVALEGFGLIAIESLASGTPCLVTPVGGLPEIVLPLDSGLVLPDCESGSIADGVVSILSGAHKPPTAEQCSDFVRNRFGWNVVLPKLLDEYALA